MKIHTHIVYIHEEIAIISVGEDIEDKNISNVNMPLYALLYVVIFCFFRLQQWGSTQLRSMRHWKENFAGNSSHLNQFLRDLSQRLPNISSSGLKHTRNRKQYSSYWTFSVRFHKCFLELWKTVTWNSGLKIHLNKMQYSAMFLGYFLCMLC